jgi:hypothetical protein
MTLLKELEVLAKQNLYKATVYVHNKIKEHSELTYKTNPELFNNPESKKLYRLLSFNSNFRFI